MWNRYGRYLESLGSDDYRDKVFAYIEKEDSQRSLPFQLKVARQSGFSGWERAASQQRLRLLPRGEMRR